MLSLSLVNLIFSAFTDNLLHCTKTIFSASKFSENISKRKRKKYLFSKKKKKEMKVKFGFFFNLYGWRYCTMKNHQYFVPFRGFI